MKKYEYKIHYLKLETGKPNEEQLTYALNQFGAEGWRLNRLHGEVSLRSLASCVATSSSKSRRSLPV